MAISSEYKQIGFDIIGCCFEVRKNSSPLLREKYYEDAVAYELRRMGYAANQQCKVPALYKGVEIADAFKTDIVVEGKVIIEVKALPYISSEEIRQLITYLYLSGMKLGYLVNFGSRDFRIGHLRSESFPFKKGIYRIVNGLY